MTRFIFRDDDEYESPAKPFELPLTPTGDRAKSRKGIQREKSASEKLAELAVNSSLHIKALPSVNFTYTGANEQKPNTAKRPKSRARIEKENDNQNVEKDDSSVERQPIVIVDPQLMTPTNHPDVNTSNDDQNKKTVEKSVKFPLRITSLNKPTTETNKYNKRLPLFAKCKIQSADQNSFVVSRSNVLRGGNLQNHSFLTLPVRFQVQPQHGERTFTLRNSAENLYPDRERSAAQSFRHTGVRLIKKLNNINRNSPRMVAW